MGTGTELTGGIRDLAGCPEYQTNTPDAETRLETTMSIYSILTGVPLCV